MDRERRVITTSADETTAFGSQLVTLFPQGGIFCFQGDLGAGKTTLIKGIVQAATGYSPAEVVSPTFTYLNSYDHVHHFDLYRLQGVDDFIALGFDEYLYAKGFICIEWSERIASLLPPTIHLITIETIQETTREIRCKSNVITPVI